ncbi:hypothetical protein V6N13_060885 [Hibiscus sabdariffa]
MSFLTNVDQTKETSISDWIPGSVLATHPLVLTALSSLNSDILSEASVNAVADVLTDAASVLGGDATLQILYMKLLEASKSIRFFINITRFFYLFSRFLNNISISVLLSPPKTDIAVNFTGHGWEENHSNMSVWWRLCHQ